MNAHSEIVILSEGGAWRHHEALLRVCAERGVRLFRCRLNFGRRLFALWRLGEADGLLTWAADFGRLCRIAAGTSRTIVAGIAPFGIWGLLLWWLQRRNRLVYHSSWPAWRRGAVPRNPNSRFLESIWRRAMSGMHTIGVTTRSASEMTAFGAPAATALPHSVDADVFHPPPAPAARDRPVVLFVGRLVADKGIDLILEVAEQLRQKGDDVEWWFVGDGPMKKQVAAASAAGIGVLALGQMEADRLAETYRNADVLVLPSISRPGWEELFGIVLIEAFASGLPVIASDCTGPSEIVDPGRTGLLIPQGDARALQEALEHVLGVEAMRRRMGQEARREAQRTYGVDVVGAGWVRVLEQIAES